MSSDYDDSLGDSSSNDEQSNELEEEEGEEEEEETGSQVTFESDSRRGSDNRRGRSRSTIQNLCQGGSGPLS